MHDLARVFVAEFGRSPRLFSAPGRVNWIGEHTDYNEGYVLPVAIGRRTQVAAAAREDRQLCVYAHDLSERAAVSLAAPSERRGPHWFSYVEGIARTLTARGYPVGGADVAVGSDVPIGAGLASSAALEIAAGFALAALSGVEVPPLELALAAQAAEHEYAGTRCGIMDQLMATLGRPGQALLIDCRTLAATLAPAELGTATLLVVNSRIKHERARAAYNERRAECERGVGALARGAAHILALRDVSTDLLEARRAELDPVIYRRCRHVVSENGRTLAAAAALRVGDLAEMGRLMVASHASLRDDFEVSSPELDLLVEVALAQPGVHGARLTGRGFGGCVIALVEAAAVAELGRALASALRERFGQPPDIFVTHAAGGVCEE